VAQPRNDLPDERSMTVNRLTQLDIYDVFGKMMRRKVSLIGNPR
jgi:hypothetical protein